MLMTDAARVCGWRPVCDSSSSLFELSSASDDALLAAALLWRIFYSVAPLPLGALTMSRFRRANPDALGPATLASVENA